MRPATIAVAAVLALAAIAPLAPAHAADRPQFPPTRDVAVTYRITTGESEGGPHEASLAFSAALLKLHAEVGGMGAMIIDVRQRSMVIVMTQQHMAMRLPAGDQIDRAMAYGGDGSVVRVGTDRVAGYPCTVWRFTGKDGSGTGCLTDDGVPLRGQSNDARNKGGFEAIRVAYGPQPASLFEVPAGVKTMDMPAGMGGAPRPRP
jgi:hypothetical protein